MVHPHPNKFTTNKLELEGSGGGVKKLEFMSTNINKMISSKNSPRKRFSDDQIKSLETTFETESRPELHLKQHLANTLGLHPRQVAIWFQNKRARSKSKQIEREYRILKSNYDHLASQLEALRKENQTLLIQVQKLRKITEKREGEDENENITIATSENPRHNGVDIMDSNEVCKAAYLSDQNRKEEYLEEEEEDGILNMAEASALENGCSFESCTFLDNTASTSLWWEF